MLPERGMCCDQSLCDQYKVVYKSKKKQKNKVTPLQASSKQTNTKTNGINKHNDTIYCTKEQ